jgi:hypothetical protein
LPLFLHLPLHDSHFGYQKICYKKYTDLNRQTLLTLWVTKVKPDHINSVDFHSQLSHNWHPVDGAMVGAVGLLWPPSKEGKVGKQTYKQKLLSLLKICNCQGQYLLACP